MKQQESKNRAPQVQRSRAAFRIAIPLLSLAIFVAALIVGGWLLPVTIVALLAMAPALIAWWRRAETGIAGVEDPPPVN